MVGSSKLRTGCALALLLGAHAFLVELAVAADTALTAVPLLWGLLLGLLAYNGAWRAIAIAGGVFTLMTPLRWFTPRWAPPVTLDWPYPVVTSPVPGIVDAIGFWMVIALATILALGAALIAALLSVIVARAERLTHPWFEKAVAVVMWGAVAAATVHTALLAGRTLTQPSPAEYISGLPVVLRAAPVQKIQSGGTFAYSDNVSAGDLTISRGMSQQDYVDFQIGRGGHVESRGWDRNRAFVVRHEVRSDLMFFDDGEGPRAISASEPTLVVASHLDLLPSVQPLRSWLVSALLGTAGAFALLLLRRRLTWSGSVAFHVAVTATALSGLVPYQPVAW